MSATHELRKVSPKMETLNKPATACGYWYTWTSPDGQTTRRYWRTASHHTGRVWVIPESSPEGYLSPCALCGNDDQDEV